MKRTMLVALAGIAASAAFAKGPAWTASLESARRLAAERHSPMMVYVYADWSRHCKQMDAALEDPKVATHFQGYIPLKVNADSVEGKKFVHTYGVRAIPSVLVLKEDGTRFDEVSGYSDPVHLADGLSLLNDKVKSFQAARNSLKSNPDDANALEVLARIYAKDWQMDLCLPILDKALKLDPENKFGKLSRALNAAGDYYQLHKKYDQAVSYFSRAASVGKQKDDIVYAYVSIGSCYLEANQPKRGVPWLKKILDMPNADLSDKRQATNLLRQAEQGKAQFHAVG